MSEQGGGAMDKAKGLVKEATGAVTSDEAKKAEGRSLREGAAGGNREYFRKVIEETNRRAAGEA